jgi:hypothetical protein
MRGPIAVPKAGRRTHTDETALVCIGLVSEGVYCLVDTTQEMSKGMERVTNHYRGLVVPSMVARPRQPSDDRGTV